LWRELESVDYPSAFRTRNPCHERQPGERALLFEPFLVIQAYQAESFPVCALLLTPMEREYVREERPRARLSVIAYRRILRCGGKPVSECANACIALTDFLVRFALLRLRTRDFGALLDQIGPQPFEPVAQGAS